jgi:chemosensory pili system protein ChpA (sensor histidine kinase/response regulator)
LPDLIYDEKNQQALSDQIAALPSADEQTGGDGVDATVPDPAGSETVATAVESVNAIHTTLAVEPDPFSDMDPELYEIFIEEASEIIDSSEVLLRAWSEEPQNNEYMTEFQRQLHTIKGGARMVDIQAIGDLSHVLESLITRIADGLIATSDELFALMQESQDRLSEMLEQVKSRQMPAVATQLQARLDALWQTESGNDTHEEIEGVSVSQCDASYEADTQAITVTSEESVQTQEPESANDMVVELAIDEGDATGCDTESVQDRKDDIELPDREHFTFPQKKERQQQARAHGEQVRVQSTLLDDMVNYAGEINIYRSRMEQQVSDYRYNLAELDQTITRLRDQLRLLEMETEAQILYRYEQEVDASNQEFDPLEMDRYSNLQQASRSLIESISDLRSLQELMENTTRESETLLLQQSRVSTDLQDGLMRSRMIPFSGLASRLRRIVRQSARQLGKKVDLELFGADGEMDRTVIDRVIAPLEHMLRNAVAHGIELPEQRKALDKKVEGLITITFDREGPEIVLRIEDDGAGINTEAIRERALERGLMVEGSQLSDYDVMQFILHTGFSTAAEVTQISGRGVGMDVVNSEVKQLGGSLHIESTAGHGTTFTVRLPYTLAINQALLVMAGNETFCVPLASIEGVVRANCEELAVCYRSDECLYYYAGNEYQLKHLGTLLNTSATGTAGTQKQVPVLLVRIGEKRIAVQVEALMGSREIVIKPVGAQLSKVDCISGATILGDGRVVMMLDMAAVARMNVRARLPEVPVDTDKESRLVIMVVDDSITVRKVTSRLLERNGFRILTAKDGIDAMGQLQDMVPDMMLLDIEMPRMDGFELATHMRNDARLKHVPIIMITSRTGDKHRERAQQIGVNNYLGKPYQESDLLDSIHRIIGVSAAGAVA